MTLVCEDDQLCCEDESALATKCLEICQALAQKGQKFSFSLKMNLFSFSLDTKEENTSVLDTRPLVKKKLSPSALKRNQKRKELFLKKKAEESEQQVKETPEHVDRTFKCDQCERTFSTENGLNIHTGRTHKNSNLPPPERLLNSSGKEEPKQVSPIKDIREEEKDDEDSSVESEEESIEETNTPTCNLCGSRQCIRLTAISIRCSSTPVYHKKCPF